jgi:sensor histidine kinase YesM
MTKKIIPHIIGWGIYLTASLLFHIFYRREPLYLVWLMTYVINIGSVYIIAYFILPRFLSKQKYYTLILALIIAYFLYVISDYLIEYKFEQWYYGKKLKATEFHKYFFPLLFIYTPFAITGWGIFFLERLRHKNKLLEQEKAEKLEALNRQLQLEAEKHEAAARTAALEKEKLELELQYLRAQINPHFLRNTLYAIGEAVRPVSREGYARIELLAELMDYSLKQPEADNKTLLSEELKAIEMLIEIFKIRYEEDCAIVYEQSGNAGRLRIAPHILMTLVENATKYGWVNDEDHPLTIELRIEGQNLWFRVHNLKLNESQPPSKGVGLSNIRRRLAIQYPGNFTLHKQEDATTYTTELTLTL